MLKKDLLQDEQNKIRFQNLRHTYTTVLLSKGVPIKYAQKQFGHAGAKITPEVYASYMPSVKFEALNILDNFNNAE